VMYFYSDQVMHFWSGVDSVVALPTRRGSPNAPGSVSRWAIKAAVFCALLTVA